MFVNKKSSNECYKNEQTCEFYICLYPNMYVQLCLVLSLDRYLKSNYNSIYTFTINSVSQLIIYITNHPELKWYTCLTPTQQTKPHIKSNHACEVQHTHVK